MKIKMIVWIILSGLIPMLAALNAYYLAQQKDQLDLQESNRKQKELKDSLHVLRLDNEKLSGTAESLRIENENLSQKLSQTALDLSAMARGFEFGTDKGHLELVYDGKVSLGFVLVNDDPKLSLRDIEGRVITWHELQTSYKLGDKQWVEIEFPSEQLTATRKRMRTRQRYDSYNTATLHLFTELQFRKGDSPIYQVFVYIKKEGSILIASAKAEGAIPFKKFFEQKFTGNDPMQFPNYDPADPDKIFREIYDMPK
ncbi:MAG: hypothetical protein ABIS36_08800 [Chryseolinea sp.]